MNETRPASARLPSLSGLGFVAICMVLVSHVGISLVLRVDPTAQTLWSYDYKLGVMGFTFFFVLTGFALTWVHEADVDARRFLRRRFARVFPAHLITITAALLLAVGAGVALSVWRTVPTLLLVQNWIPDQEVVLTGNPNGPTWALSCALLFYAMFPWTNRLVRRIRPERLWMPALASVVLLITVPLLATLLPAEPLLVNTPDSWLQTWFVGYLPVTRMLEFLLGVFVARMVATRRWHGPGVIVSVLLSVAGLVASASMHGESSGFAVTAVPLALLIAAVARRESAGRRTFFGSRPMTVLGQISFCAYLVHWVVISYGPIHTADPANWTRPLSLGGALGKSALTIVAVLLLGWLLSVLVERPALRLLGGRRKAEPLAEPVVVPLGDPRPGAGAP
ncbi:acyltransferase family protein (plasmid) [Streptomyces finlayi]|uniref:Acyltransferase family protein n=1 Tax=Streptomyces finlayi TaxID=67296 RepID=A0A7G7BWF4_9ACTN|nr:acyltransferase [Streptomyces finlayi]QNE79669.1 acyltransferase family protein [Streptomyces finlayi]